MKIYKHRWWHDSDKLVAAVCFGLCLALVVAFVVDRCLPVAPTPTQAEQRV